MLAKKIACSNYDETVPEMKSMYVPLSIHYRGKPRFTSRSEIREHESERRARPPLSLSRESGIDHLTKPRGNIQARFMQRLCLVKASQKIIETAHVCSIKYEFGESLSLSHATFYLLELHKIETAHLYSRLFSFTWYE